MVACSSAGSVVCSAGLSARSEAVGGHVASTARLGRRERSVRDRDGFAGSRGEGLLGCSGCEKRRRSHLLGGHCG